MTDKNIIQCLQNEIAILRVVIENLEKLLEAEREDYDHAVNAAEIHMSEIASNRSQEIDELKDVIQGMSCRENHLQLEIEFYRSRNWWQRLLNHQPDILGYRKELRNDK